MPDNQNNRLALEVFDWMDIRGICLPQVEVEGLWRRKTNEELMK